LNIDKFFDKLEAHVLSVVTSRLTPLTRCERKICRSEIRRHAKFAGVIVKSYSTVTNFGGELTNQRVNETL